MGAGENAVVSIILQLLSAGKGALLVIDEIELGLHAKAQKAFINELKKICEESKCQIVCSTHSDVVLDALPPEGRFFLESKPSRTVVTQEITSEYAFGKLSGKNTGIFVEDETAKAIVLNVLPIDLKERVVIYPIGSDQAVLRQMAAHYREGKHNFMSFLDGDKRTKRTEQLKQIIDYLERVDEPTIVSEEMKTRLHYLPGETWPEKYIIEQLLRSGECNQLAERWGADRDDVTAFLEQALAAGKHNEFFKLSQNVFLDKTSVRDDCIQCYKSNYQQDLAYIKTNINSQLRNV